MSRWGNVGRAALLRVSVSALIAATAGLGVASAQEAAVDFNIPRGGLGSVVNAIASTGGQSISFKSELAAGRVAGPIKGRKSVRAALAEALAGSGLSVADSGGALTIVASGAQRSAGVNANSATDVVDIDVVGTKTGDQGFVAGETASSTRIEAPLQDTPMSITGITKDALTTQAATSGYDAATNVSNVAVTPPSGGSSIAPSYTVRGATANSVLIQGQSAIGSNIPIQDIERVDVVKGPTTILSGVALPGGAINLVTKQPTSTPIREVSVYLGSYGYKTIAFDLGGPVPQTEGVTYRLNMSANTADHNFGGYKDPHEYLFSPSVRWEDARTTVEGGFRFVQNKVDPTPFSFFLSQDPGASPFKLGRTQIVGNDQAHANNYLYQPYFSAQRILGDVDLGYFGKAEVTFHSRTQYSKNIFNSSVFTPAAIIGFTPNSGILVLGGVANRVNSDLVTTSQDITIKQQTQYITQTARFGVDYNYQGVLTNGTFQYPPSPFTIYPYGPGSGFPYTAYNGSPLPTLTRIGPPSTLTTDDVGLSFQDNIDVADRLHIMGAVRQDTYSQHTGDVTNNVTTNSNSTQYALSYQAGASFDVLPWLAVYGVSGTGFVPVAVVLANGGAAPPLTSTNDEVGAKLQLLDRRLVLTGALYDLSYSNTVFNNGAGNVVGPGFQSRGIETDIQGDITPNLKAIGSFAFARFNQQSQGDNVAVRVPGAPSITASAFLNYTFLEGPLRGFSLGAGGHGNGLSYAQAQSGNTVYRIPGYVLADFYAGLHRDSFDINFKLANAFNKYYFLPSETVNYIPIGEGRTFSLVMKHQF